MAHSGLAGRATLFVVAAVAVAATAAPPAAAHTQASLARPGHRADGMGRQLLALRTGKAIHVGHSPCAIAITPNGRTAYVVNCDDDTLTPISLATGTPKPAINFGRTPGAIAITPNGRTAYVTNEGVKDN